MRRKLALVGVMGLLAVVSLAWAEDLPDATRATGELLRNGQIEMAKQRIDACLQKNPADADAWMMRGVAILKERQSTALDKFCYPDESVFTRLNGAVETALLLIPQPVALETAQAWRKALEIAPSRRELHESLAYLYAQALMKPELLAELGELKMVAGEVPELKFLMCDLARSLAERNALADAMEAYQTVLGYYPEEPAVYAELAEMLVRHGKLAEAQQFLGKALALPNPDKRQLYRTAFRVWVVAGDYVKAQAALDAWSRLTYKRDNRFYKALFLYYSGNPKWMAEMKSFLAAPYDQCEKNHRELANFLVSPANKHDYAAYLKSLTFKVDSDLVVLLHRRGMVRFPVQAGPGIKYAEFMNTYQNYPEALQILRGMESKIAVGPEWAESFNLQFAWALQNTVGSTEANLRWQKLLNAKDFFIKSAGVYFYGKNLLAAGKLEEGRRFLQMIAKQAVSSKYAFYSQLILQQIETGSQPNPAIGSQNGEPHD